MDAGGLAQMTFNGFSSNGLGVPGSGFASRNRGSNNNSKRLSLALPPKVNSINEHQTDPNPTPRTSRAHLLSGLRTQPKNGSATPASAPYDHQRYQGHGNGYGESNNYNAYNQGMPQTASGAGFTGNQYAAHNARQSQMFTMPEQVLAPPTFYTGQDSEMDPSVMEQLQLTSYFLAERQRQLQQQLASITAAANVQAQLQGNVQAQLQGLNMSQFQHGQMTPVSPQNGVYGQQQQQKAQSPMEVPGQPGMFAVYNPMTGQYQYVMDNSQQQTPLSPVSINQNYGNMMETPSKYSQQTPAFRAEISPPPTERPTPSTSRSITPPKKSPSPPSTLSHVEPLPPPSANAFRRGHKKATSLAINSMTGVNDGPKTAGVNGSARTVFPPTPMTGGFGPGAARAGEHPMRQPRNPPNLEELVAAPTAKHEGSKNFATRQRRAALTNLMRAGSFRRAVSGGSSRNSPVSEGELSFRADFDEQPYRKQSPIGYERHAQKGSNGSLEGLGAMGGAVQTPGSEKSQGDAFDMNSFVRNLPSPVQQGQERRKMMFGSLMSAAEKRKTIF